LTGDMGANFVQLLTQQQAELLYALVRANKPLLTQMVEVRRAVAVELRKPIAGQPLDNDAVLKLCDRYGQLDGEFVYGMATAYAQIAKSLTTQQVAQVAALRKQAGDFSPRGAYLYSTPIAMPTIRNTDFLFGVK